MLNDLWSFAKLLWPNDCISVKVCIKICTLIDLWVVCLINLNIVLHFQHNCGCNLNSCQLLLHSWKLYAYKLAFLPHFSIILSSLPSSPTSLSPTASVVWFVDCVQLLCHVFIIAVLLGRPILSASLSIAANISKYSETWHIAQTL